MSKDAGATGSGELSNTARQTDDHRCPFSYRLACFHVQSQLALPELNNYTIAQSEHGSPDIQIHLGAVPRQLDHPLHETAFYQLDKNHLLLTLPGIARYMVADGQQVMIEPDPEAKEQDIRVFLLGSIFGVLCHQRGVLPLHASAIEYQGRAYAFAGPSGAGKSTLAAVFQKHGFRLIGDDICVITKQESHFLIHPDMPRIKLWENSLEYLGVGTHREQVSKVRNGLNKYFIPMRDYDQQPIPLHGIYELSRQEESDAPCREQLRPFDAVTALTVNVYRSELVQQMGRGAGLFKAASAIAASIPVYRFKRPWGLNRMEEDMAWLIRQWETET